MEGQSSFSVFRPLVLVAILILSGLSCLAAKEKHTLKLFFAINEFTIKRSDVEKAIIEDGLSFELMQGVVSEIHITGFTDCSGSGIYNLILAEKRAQAVAAHWKDIIGIQQATIKAEGEAGCDPGETEYNETLRRVEIEFELEMAGNSSNARVEGDFTSASTASVGAILPITGLNFIGGKHYPLVRSYEVLDELEKIMKENPTLVIEIQGHVCCGNVPTVDGTDLDTGEPKLSENRAKFVYEHLIKNGIPPERMSYKGFAETRPLPITLEDPGLESLNRRVEIMIVSK